MGERILLVDDEPGLLSGLRRRLRGQYAVDVAGSGMEALARVREQGPYAVVVSDMRMPGMDGAELLEQVARHAPDTVRIMLTGNSDQQTAVDAVNRGRVFRFLNKPCPPGALELALDEGLAAYRNSHAQHRAYAEALARARTLSERLSHHGRHDRLTDLLDRDSFMQELATQLQRGGPAMLAYMDIDRFRLWIDTYGQLAGDELLRHFASMVRASGLDGDRFARLGGDVFAALLVGSGPDGAVLRLQQIRGDLRRIHLPWADKGLSVDLCAGLLDLDHETALDPAACLETAEVGCHLAKEQGGGRSHVVAPDDPVLSYRRREGETLAEFSQALREERFELYYQRIEPIHASAAAAHLELLVRMREPGGAFSPPGAFLPIAEKYALTPRLDLLVVRKALQWLADKGDAAAHIGLCSINLSGHSLSSPDVLSEVATMVEQSGVSFERIGFEITENAAVTNMSLAAEFIGALRSRGCRFSLDDFGSGLSSFAYLRALPVDYLKIDGSFVRDMETNAANRALVRAMNEVGHALGKRTVAEYVENPAILELLRGISVDYAQGYGIGRPRPLAEL